MDCSTPGSPVLQSPGVCSHSCPLSRWFYLTTSNPLPPPSSFAFSLFQHQGLFQWVSSLHGVAEVLKLQHQSFQWIFRVNFLQNWLVWSPCSPRDSQKFFSSTTVGKINVMWLQGPWTCLKTIVKGLTMCLVGALCEVGGCPSCGLSGPPQEGCLQ